MTSKILIVEDDNSLQEFLKELLLDNGYSVQLAGDGVSALSLVKKITPDLVLLDLGLPVMSGESVCQEIRKQYPDLPILMLTAKDNLADIVNGLNLGADDYMSKPFVADELLARIKARLRSQQTGDSLIVDDLELNTRTFEVKRAGKSIKLTRLEFNLLSYLMMSKGRVLTREMILTRIWNSSPDIETRVVDVYIGYLRKKIDKPFKKKLIKSVRGFGYQLKD